MMKKLLEWLLVLEFIANKNTHPTLKIYIPYKFFETVHVFNINGLIEMAKGKLFKYV